MKRFNICKKMEYISNGEKKTFWERVGTMVEFQKEDGSSSRIIEIPAIGLKANVFEEKPKVKTSDISDDINPDDLPF